MTGDANSGVHNLLIVNAKSDDNGEFQCQASLIFELYSVSIYQVHISRTYNNELTSNSKLSTSFSCFQKDFQENKRFAINQS